MERYEKYKDSGVEWIGEIPEGWEVKKLKYVADANPSNVDKKSKDNEDSVLLCNYVDVYKNEFISSELNFMKATASNDQITKFILKKGDVIITKDSETPDDIAAPALVAESFDNVVCGYHLTHIKPKNINGDFLFRYFQSKYLNSYFEVSANGVTRYGLSVDKISSALILNPPRPDQTTIANYLDRKTAEIDKLIAQKERLLELYEEEKTAIINQAVTKGIDPDVKFKDSGIDWLGEIPEGWEVISLKRATNIFRGKFGHRPRNDPEFYNGDYPFIQTGDVTNSDKYIKQFHQTLNEKGFSVSQEFPANTLVMTIAANIGDLAILSFKACFPDSIVGFYPSNGNSSEFLYYLFSSMKKVFLKVSTSNTQLNINIDRIAPLKITIPPLSDQSAIVHHIETETARINAKIAKTKRIIELQKEYRTALISEVVTGKIKVTTKEYYE